MVHTVVFFYTLVYLVLFSVIKAKSLWSCSWRKRNKNQPSIFLGFLQSNFVFHQLQLTQQFVCVLDGEQRERRKSIFIFYFKTQWLKHFFFYQIVFLFPIFLKKHYLYAGTQEASQQLNERRIKLPLFLKQMQRLKPDSEGFHQFGVFLTFEFLMKEFFGADRDQIPMENYWICEFFAGSRFLLLQTVDIVRS